MKRVRVPVPPLPEQERIVAEVERRLSVLDAVEAIVDASATRCTRLRQSILKLAFEGKLVTSDTLATLEIDQLALFAAEPP